MAQIYVDDETKKELDKLAIKECRANSDEIRFLVVARVEELRAENAKSAG